MTFSQKQWFEVKNVYWWICLKICNFSLHKMLIDGLGLVWITCGSLWCLYQLFELLFWWHPFNYKGSIGEQGDTCSISYLFWWRNKLIYILNVEFSCYDELFWIIPKPRFATIITIHLCWYCTVFCYKTCM